MNFYRPQSRWPNVSALPARQYIVARTAASGKKLIDDLYAK
jgi:hypothetical protein